MSEQEINDEGIYVEPYGGGFLIADYRDSSMAHFCGSDFVWRGQPITHNPFIDRVNAIEAASQLVS